MNLLLDSNALIWWLRNDGTLSATAVAAINDASAVYVSVAAVWEIAIKRNLGRLRVPDDLQEQIERHRFAPLVISLEHALVAGSLPRHHDDPFDRMQIAQAQVEDLVIVSRDGEFAPYGVPVLRA